MWILQLDPLGSTILTLSAVKNCLIQLRKKKVSVFGRWSRIILGRISQKFVFLFTSMSPSLLCRSVLKIWNIHISLTERMNGEEGWVCARNWWWLLLLYQIDFVKGLSRLGFLHAIGLSKHSLHFLKSVYFWMIFYPLIHERRKKFIHSGN